MSPFAGTWVGFVLAALSEGPVEAPFILSVGINGLFYKAGGHLILVVFHTMEAFRDKVERATV